MAYFQDLNDVINKVLEMIWKDEKLLKLVAYPNNSIKKEDLFLKNIFPIPRGFDSVNEQKSFINVYCDSFYPYEGNSGFRGTYLCFDVVSHLNIWADKENSIIRPYEMCAEIDRMLNNQSNDNTRQISINPPYFAEGKVYRYGEFFYGYKLKYHISADSNVGGKNKC